MDAEELRAENAELREVLARLAKLARHLQPRFSDAVLLMSALDVSYEVHDDEPTVGDLRRAVALLEAKG